MTHEGETSATDASGGQGVQVGTGNTQYNTFQQRTSVDPESLGALSPHAAITRLRDMSHDDRVYVVAKAPPGDVAEVVKALLEADEAMVVAVFGDVNPRRARDLAAPFAADFPWLGPLPDAATAIDRRAAAMKWVAAPPARHLHRLEVAGRRTIGFTRTYLQGQIYWTARGGACTLSGAIGEYHASHGGILRLGYPTSDESHLPSSPFDTEGSNQAFERGRIYSSALGTWGVSGAIFRKYAELDGTGSWLGFPVAEASTSGLVITQQFEGGAICVNKGSIHAVRRVVANCAGDGWLPVSDEAAIPASAHSVAGTSQEFESASGSRMIIYSSPHGSHGVSGCMLDYYLARGAARSWLGFPTASEGLVRDVSGRAIPGSAAPGSATATGMPSGQLFDGGVVYARPGSGPVAVPWASIEFIARNRDVLDRLGFPVAEEESIGSGTDRIQFFENGNLTLRNGTREIWLRPPDRHAPPRDAPASEWMVPGYAWERQIGWGPSGRVVAAVHMVPEDRVAIKYLSPTLVNDPGFLAGFRGEAAMLRELRGIPQVVQFRDYVEEPGQGAAIVMELVDGISLHELISRNGPTGPEAALAVLRVSLLGLAALHQRGIVHRDYKPENVIIDAEGNSRLTDFGGAVAAGARVPTAGTPLYMAPEMWAGAPPAPASDVYAATAVFYECLTGRPPFSGTLDGLRHQHESDPVPLDGIDERFCALIVRGLAKDPRERPANAMEFLAEVTAAAEAAYQSGWAAQVGRQLRRRVASMRSSGQQGA